MSDVDGTLLKEKSDFAPIPALEANATDVTLFFLSTNGVAFTKPCDDSWYHAHTQKTASLIGSGEPATFYVGEEPARVLGCATRYQFCNPDPKIGRSCTPLTGIFTATAAAGALWQTKKQQDFFNTISTSILTGAGGLYDIVVTTGISSLIARHGLAVGVQGLLPSNQWQLEVENWFGVTLADLQRVTVELVTGPADPAIFRFLERPQTDEERLVCRSLVSCLFLPFSSSFSLQKGLILEKKRKEPPANVTSSYRKLEATQSHHLVCLGSASCSV